MHRIVVTLLAFYAVLLASCELPTTQEAGGTSVTIMTFNVENLFDNQDDPGKDDKAYLPLDAKQDAEHIASCNEIEVARWREQCLGWDWSDELIDKKLTAIAQSILQVNDGRGPDIIALQEIENMHILEKLRTEHLSEAGYLPGILIEGRDERGIDVAFLSRFRTATEPVLHEIEFSGAYAANEADTRGILQADFVLPDGALLTGFSVHFPAPYHPTEMRFDAYNSLNRVADRLPANRMRFAAGDFNTTSSEDRNKNMLDRFVRPFWTVAHDLGCGECRGTQFYAPDKSWSFLDMILWSGGKTRGANATWGVRESGVYLANKAPEQRLDDGTPKRFALPAGSGVSDHWPLVMTIELK